MAKKNMIARELKRKKLVARFSETRSLLLKKYSLAQTLDEKFSIAQKIQKLPRNSSLSRVRNRCWKTGKPRGYSRFFGVCRNVLREMAHQGYFPGVLKASW